MVLFFKRTNYLILLLFISISAFGQQTGIIRGIIKDVKSNEDIIGASCINSRINERSSY